MPTATAAPTKYEETFVNLARTTHALEDATEMLLKPFGLSLAQYNVLRILDGAGGCGAGLGRNDIRERLVARMPDVTRLLDRMEESGLVRRERDPQDRRCVPTYLTDRATALLAEIHGPLQELEARWFGSLTAAQLETLNALLTLVRMNG